MKKLLLSVVIVFVLFAGAFAVTVAPPEDKPSAAAANVKCENGVCKPVPPPVAPMNVEPFANKRIFERYATDWKFIVVKAIGGIIFMCLGAFLFSVIFWGTYRWMVLRKQVVAKKDKRQGKR